MIKRNYSFKELEPPGTINGSVVDSNPTLSAKKSEFLDALTAFPELMRHQDAPDMLKKKYKLAKLVHHNYNVSKRWYVSFWAMDVSKDKYVRRRLYVNKSKTIQGRIREADLIIKTVNGQLTAGKVLGKDKLPKSTTTDVTKLSLLEAIEFVYLEKIKNKHRDNYTRRIKSLKNKLASWLEFAKRFDFKLKEFDLEDTLDFFDYLRENVGTNKTFNNYRNDFSICMNFLIKRSPRLFSSNPVLAVDMLPTNTKRHAAYNDEQVGKIQAECIKLGYNNLLVFIQFIYYTLGRPGELRGLRVGDIKLDQRKILFRAEISKNRRDEFVGINGPLMKTIEDYKIMDHPKDHFIFGHNGPGEKPVSRLFFYRRFVKVLQSVGFDKLEEDHDMYSFKHSGVISLYMATKDIKLCQRQCRHTNVSQTDTYLRNLGLMDNFDSLQNWQGAF